MQRRRRGRRKRSRRSGLSAYGIVAFLLRVQKAEGRDTEASRTRSGSRRDANGCRRMSRKSSTPDRCDARSAALTQSRPVASPNRLQTHRVFVMDDDAPTAPHSRTAASIFIDDFPDSAEHPPRLASTWVRRNPCPIHLNSCKKSALPPTESRVKTARIACPSPSEWRYWKEWIRQGSALMETSSTSPTYSTTSSTRGISKRPKHASTRWSSLVAAHIPSSGAPRSASVGPVKAPRPLSTSFRSEERR